MKLFISWSGTASQQIAQELREWLPLVIPVKPFITTTDIEKGARWQGEISKELEESNFGIVCLTADNLRSPWLAFEAGALSKQLSGRVATLLVGLEHNQVLAPLNMFQGTRFNEGDFRQLVTTINGSILPELRREDAQIDKLFAKLWPDLETAINLIAQGAGDNAAVQEQPAQNINAATDELMALVRQQHAILSSPERFLEPVLSKIDKLFDPTLPAEASELIGAFRAARTRRVWEAARRGVTQPPQEDKPDK